MGRERTGKRQHKILSEANLTPLIDLTFLLLITFIITFPSLEQGITVRLPQGKTDKIEQNKSSSITINALGKIYYDNREITLDELNQTLEPIGKMEDPPALLIRCDEENKYGTLMQVLKIIHQNKISKMALVTDPSK